MVRIFIESEKATSNEGHFVEQYVRHLNQNAVVKIDPVGGKSKFPTIIPLIQTYTNDGDTNLVIFDADYSGIDNGGFIARRQWLDSIKKDNNLSFELFLFPNNADDGVFEDLLLHIINPQHQGIVNCFSQYEKCVNGQNIGNVYETPNLKAKIYSYITSFKESNRWKESVKNGNWHFDNPKYWDLDHPYLNPLKEFLSKYL